MTIQDGVAPALGKALARRGYEQLTPVQEAMLTEEVGGSDLLVSAQTGSGKTVAFGLVLAETLLGGKDRFEPADTPLGLVVAPTRELALQVRKELEWLFADTGCQVASCVGGMDMRTERRALDRGAHLVVGTPGRLRDHIERHSLNMKALSVIVLDEADEMLDLGFREDLEFILGAAPEERRTLMFSATVPKSINTLAKRYQRNALRISTTAEREQHGDIEYRALTVAARDQENAIINVLRFVEAENALVFCATRAAVNRMTSRFTNRGFSVVALSGELSQAQRTHALQSMRDGRARVCIATDVAARGIDLPNLELVIHADLPRNKESLLHRSGRTGRAGRKGVSVLIVPHNARKRTERLLSSANITANWGKPPTIDEITAKDRQRILDDPALTEPLTEQEQGFAGELLARHAPEQIAAALLRLHNAGRSAPEELIDADIPNEPRRERRQRPGFENSAWISLSVGRKHRAEPRWIVPMICRAGKLNKQDIGAIRVLNNETHVELSEECIDRFLGLIGPNALIEKSVQVRRIEKGGSSTPAAADRKPAERAAKAERENADRPHKPGKPASRKEARRADQKIKKKKSKPKKRHKPRTGNRFKGRPAEDKVSESAELARQKQGGYGPRKRRKPADKQT